jgi:hypothetical protein
MRKTDAADVEAILAQTALDFEREVPVTVHGAERPEWRDLLVAQMILTPLECIRDIRLSKGVWVGCGCWLDGYLSDRGEIC